MATSLSQCCNAKKEMCGERKLPSSLIVLLDTYVETILQPHHMLMRSLLPQLFKTASSINLPLRMQKSDAYANPSAFVYFET
jgi:hypothetical protein